MLSASCVLGPFGCREVSPPRSTVGFRGYVEYCERLHDTCATATDDLAPEYSEKAKGWPVVCVCAWAVVSSIVVPASRCSQLTGHSICVVSILRLPVLIAAAKSKDPTGDNPAVAKWSIVELNTAIICASLITLRPLIFRWFPGLLGSKDVDEQSGPISNLMQRTVGSASTPGHAANRHDSLLRSGNDWGTWQCESTDQASSTISGGATKEQSARGAGVAVSIASNEV